MDVYHLLSAFAHIELYLIEDALVGEVRDVREVSGLD